MNSATDLAPAAAKVQPVAEEQTQTSVAEEQTQTSVAEEQTQTSVAEEQTQTVKDAPFCWEDLDLHPALLRGIFAHGFEKPSAIQTTALPPLLQGRDVLAQCGSGLGKTTCFSIGALARADPAKAQTQVLILVPTHELAHQIAGVMNSLSTAIPGMRIHTAVGGAAVWTRDAPPAQIVVGCPGRVYDMIRRRQLRPDYLKTVVLDEADEMLSSGFKEQVHDICQYVPAETQFALFSATLPDYFLDIAEKLLRDPVKLCVKAENLTLEGIKQYFVALDDDRQKAATVKDLYTHLNVAQCIIYANSVNRVMDLYEDMLRDNFPVACLHSNMERSERERVFKDFRTGATRVLISSNVTARGIDVQQVSVVINFDLPRDVHTYLHRIGRSGRWGRKGTAVNFITRRDVPKMREIEAWYKTTIEELPMQLDF
jgi:translation initiation factor 4A